MKESRLAHELQQGEKGYENIQHLLDYLEDMESIFILLGSDQKIAYINNVGCNALETKYGLAIGQNWFDHFIQEPDRQHIKTVFDELMSGNVEHFDTHTNIVQTSNGNKVKIRWDNSLIRSETKEIVGSFSLGKEIKSEDVKTSSISICSYCKDIRNPDEQWAKLEKYFADNHGLSFSHGICPCCLGNELEKL